MICMPWYDFLQINNVFAYVWIYVVKYILKMDWQDIDHILTSICLCGNVIEKYLRENFNFTLNFCMLIFKCSEVNITRY